MKSVVKTETLFGLGDLPHDVSNHVGENNMGTTPKREPLFGLGVLPHDVSNRLSQPSHDVKLVEA